MSDDGLRDRLTDLQFQVTQCSATEPPFRNPYWNEKRRGIYVDVVDGTPLFRSSDKYDSGTGWPSFTRPIDPDKVSSHIDNQLRTPRTEIRSASSDAHLGHLFPDGPGPLGTRYCMNSASLRFIPVEQMAEAGYAEWIPLLDPER